MLKIHYDKEAILHKKMTPCQTPITEKDKQIAKEMNEYIRLSQDTEYAKKNKLRPGIGLAAPQIGLDKRIIAIYLNDKDKLYSYALINPVVKQRSLKQCYLAYGEGCLSVKKDYDGFVYRNFRIIVEAYDAIQDKEIKIDAIGYFAICLQHELDHLEGILYYDRINPFDPFEIKEDAIKIE